MIRETVVRFMRRRSVTRAAVMIFVACLVGSPRLAAGGVVGQWDFANGWNAGTGLVPAVSGISGLSLSYLPNTPLYQNPAAHDFGTPPSNPPQLAFGSTSDFGITNLGDSSDTVVMKMPDMRSYGLVTGLMAKFPQMANGDGSPTKLNRYSVVMDVYVPQATDAQQPPEYLTLFQTRLVNDGAWLIDKRDDITGVASSYGGTVTPNAWHRLALVMNLSDSGAVSQYRAYVNGSLAADIVPDTVPQTSSRNIALYDTDLFTDGNFSIGTLDDSYPGLGPDSAFFLFNADRNSGVDSMTKGELGELYVANLQFRDDALTDSQVAALGGPAPGPIPVPEPGTLGLLAAAGFAAAAGLSRRRLLAGLGACGTAAVAEYGSLEAAAAQIAAPPPPVGTDQPATAGTRGPLADYVAAADGSTEWTRIAGGDFAACRFVAAELVSQTWRGLPWRHQLAVCIPGTLAVERPPVLLWIDGGSTPEGAVTPPAKQLPIIAAIAEAAGLPAAVVRQVPNQPLEGGRREDDLIAHTFEQFFRTGDPTWPLLLPMVKSVAAALDAVAALAHDEWQLDLDGCVVAGASKRGWTSWLAAAVEPRVRGLVPMVIDMLDLPRHMQLQVESFGAPSQAIHDYVSRDLHRRLDSPRGHELLAIVDPVRHAAAITQPKVIALGTNDEYWPLESHALYRERLRGPTWVSYVPNAGHDIPPLRVAPLVAALGRHVAGAEPLPDVAWSCDAGARTCTIAADPLPAAALLWTTTSDSRDFRGARWTARPMDLGAGSCREQVEPPAAGFRAVLVECRYDRAPLPVYLSTGPLILPAG
jgi:PhoPQ-activated pathogenicity-related protein